MGLYKSRIFFILLLFCTSAIANADIPIGSLITYTRPFISNERIIITNKDQQQLPSISGLQLFAGDRIQTNTEEIFLLIPSTGLIVNVKSFSEVSFNVLDLGLKRYVIQVIAHVGSLELLLHRENDILQLLQGVTPPKKVSRIDRLVDTSSSSMIQYTQVINAGADILSTNIDYDSKVFVTQADFDIAKFIETYNRSDNKDKSLLLEKIAPPSSQAKLTALHQFTFNIHLKNLTEAQYISGFYSLKLEKDKFFTTLQIPIFFPRDGWIYNPVGENDWLFGLPALGISEMSTSDKILTIASHSALNVLNKIKNLSYGTQKDFFYLYYGDQKEWHNDRSTLFAYHYNPIKGFPNNFNKDLIMLINSKRFGYEFRVRQFQPTSFDRLIYDNFNIAYNRFWIRPTLPLNTFEIGVFAAGDFSVGQLNAQDTEMFELKDTLDTLSPDTATTNAKTDSYIMGITGLDVTFPLVNFRNYLLESNSEFALYLPFKSTGYFRTSKLTYVNYVAKSGFINTFFSKKHNTAKQGFNVNVYYATGLAKPHYAMGGYEYTYMFYRTRSMAMLELDSATPSTETSIFRQSSLIPEVDYFVKGIFLDLAIGTYVPINFSPNTFLYPNPAINTSITFKFDPILPRNLHLHITGQYTISNLRGVYDGFDIPAMLESIAPQSNYLNAHINFEISNLIGTTVGVFTTPQYGEETGNLILNETSSPTLDIMPFASLYIKIQRFGKK